MKKLLLSAMLLCSTLVLAEEHHHDHKAPHGGTLVGLGDHFAHLELVLDPKDGKLILYVLDGEAEKALRIKDKEIELKLFVPLEPDPQHSAETKRLHEFVARLKAVANPLTGEKEGDTSQFAETLDPLKNAKKFDVQIAELKVRGQTFKDVKFSFPKGNEPGAKDAHDHDHGKKPEKK